jgi:hypothetical protein
LPKQLQQKKKNKKFSFVLLHSLKILTISSYLQDKVSATEEYIERVTDQVIRPYQQKVIASTEEYTKQVADVAKRNKDIVEQKTKDTLNALIERADNAIDYVLPEVDQSTPVAAATVPATPELARTNTPVEETSRLTFKIADRLHKRATKVYQYSTDRAKQIVHIDLIAYAKETLGADEAKIAKAFDKVISLLPTPETTAKVTDKVVQKLPTKVQPVAQQGASYIAPVVNTALATLITVIFFIRSYFVSTPASQPIVPEQQQPASPDVSRQAQQVMPTDDTVNSQDTEIQHDAATSASRKKRSNKGKKSDTATSVPADGHAADSKDDAVVA